MGNAFKSGLCLLAQGHIPGGMKLPIQEPGKGDLEVAEYYWFPMLAGLSDLTSDPRVEVRNCALEVLFDLLKERGHQFSSAFWESVFHRVLFPIFDYVRHAGKDGEKPAASSDQWLRETCIHSLQLLCDLFSSFYKVCPTSTVSSYHFYGCSLDHEINEYIARILSKIYFP